MGRDETADEAAYTSAIARVTSQLSTASPAGLGMLVSPTQVVTCAHVVNIALGRGLLEQAAPGAGEKVEVSFPLLDGGAAVRRGQVVAWVPPPQGGTGGGDIAGLLLGEVAPDGATPARFATARPQPGAWGRVFGYPGESPEWAQGKWVDVDVKGEVGGHLLQVESRSNQTVKAQPGYSGSPVWDPGTGAAVGLLQVAPFADRPERDAYLVPPSSIAESWDDPFDYLLVQENPYRGLQPFTSDDAAVFFGRDRDIADLLALVLTQPVVVVVGSSGVGKSSLVHAGLVVKWRQQRRSVALLRPGVDPWHRLAAGLLEAQGIPGAEITLPQTENLMARLRSEGLGFLARFLRSQNRDLLVVVDQFEELMAAAGPKDQRLIQLLLPPPEAAEDAARVVLTLRTDFLQTLQSIPGVQLNGRTYFVSPLTAEQMRQAVQRPAETRKVAFESEALVDEIVRDASGGALPLLEFTLMRLWATQRHAKLTFEGYRSMGGIDGVLEQVAEEAVMQLTGPAADRLDQVLLRLVRVTPDSPGLATRQRVYKRDVLGEEWQVLQRLEVARLTSVDTDSAEEQYAELTHESLITAWRRLRDLVSGNSEFLTWLARVRQRAAEGDPLPDARIPEARHWLDTRPADVPDEVRSFVESSETAAEARLREVRDARDRAEAAREQAERAARRAEALRLAASAELALRGTHAPTVVALALATESLLTEPTLQGDLALRNVFRVHPRTWPGLEHDDAVLAVAFSADGTMLATGSADCSARVFDPFTGRQLARLDHDGAVNGVTFSPDGTRVATASADFSAQVFDALTGRQLARLDHDGPVTAVAFSADGARIETASDRSVRVFDCATGAELSRRNRTSMAHELGFGPDGLFVSTANTAADESEWLSGPLVTSSLVPVTGPRAVPVSDPVTGEDRGLLLNHDGPVTAVAVSRPGRIVATTSDDFSVRLSTAKGAELSRLDHDGPVNAVAFSPDGTMVATASEDHSARVYDPLTGTELCRLDHDSSVIAVAFSPDSTHIATGSGVDRSAWLLDPVTGTRSAQVFDPFPRVEFDRLPHSDAVTAVAFSPSGSMVATASGDRWAWLRDTATGDQLFELEHDGPVNAVAFSSDGTALATASSDSSARLFDPATGAEMTRLDQASAVNAVAFSPDGTRLATASDDFSAQVFDLATAKRLFLLDHDGPVHGVAFAPDGACLATASDDRSAWVFDSVTGRRLAQLVHDGPVKAVAFSPDGTMLATASGDLSARLFDLATGKQLFRLDHDGAVLGVAFSRDGTRLATASGDRSARVFDPATGAELTRLDHRSAVFGVAFHPNSTHIVTACQDHMARLFEVSPELLLRRALDLMTRPLNVPELRRYSLPAQCRHVEQWERRHSGVGPQV